MKMMAFTLKALVCLAAIAGLATAAGAATPNASPSPSPAANPAAPSSKASSKLSNATETAPRKTKKQASKDPVGDPSSHSLEAIPVPGTKALTLDEALKVSMEYSQELKTAYSGVGQSQAQLSQEKGLLFPTINGVGSAVNKTNATSNTAGSAAGQSSVTSANGDAYTVGLTLSQPLYAGGAISNGLGLYESSVESARQSYFSAKQTVIFNTLAAYFLMANNQETLNVAKSNSEILKAFLDITTHYAHIGRARQIDQLQADVNRELGLGTEENAGDTLKQSTAALKRLLGMPKDTPISANFAAVINPLEKITLDDAYIEGEKNNPLIRIAQINVEQVDYTEGIDLGTNDMPTLFLNGTAGYTSPDTSTLFTTPSQYYSIGLNLTVPIFSGLSSLAKRHVYSEKKYQAERGLQIAKDTLRQNILQALEDLNSLKSQLIIAEQSVKKGRLALDLATKGYQQGIASSNDVTNMQNARYNAETYFVTTQYRYLNSLANLRLQMGVDLEKAYVH